MIRPLKWNNLGYQFSSYGEWFGKCFGYMRRFLKCFNFVWTFPIVFWRLLKCPMLPRKKGNFWTAANISVCSAFDRGKYSNKVTLRYRRPKHVHPNINLVIWLVLQCTVLYWFNFCLRRLFVGTQGWFQLLFLWMKVLIVTIQMNAFELYFPVVMVKNMVNAII